MKRAEGQVKDATVKRIHKTNNNHMTASDPRLVGRRIEAGLREKGFRKRHIRFVLQSKSDLIHVHNNSTMIARSEQNAQFADTDTHHDLPLRLVHRILTQ